MTTTGVTPYKQRDRRSVGRGHPIMFGLPEAAYFGPFPDGGGYPHRFLTRAFAILHVTDPTRVLHVCSGSMRIGVTVDIRPSVRPMVIADVLKLPFRDDSFPWVMADPPYSRMYAENLYGTGDMYPDPHQLIEECLRVVEPDGYVGFMHHMVPKFKRPGRLVKVYTITQGPGYNVRAWTVFTKDLPGVGRTEDVA